MRERIAAVLSGLTLSVGLAVAPAPPADAVTWGGGADNGYADAPNFWNGHAEVFAGWTRASDDPSGTGHLTVYVKITGGAMPLYNGHKQCVQVATDFRIPQRDSSGNPILAEHHYDARIVRNCDDTGTPTIIKIGYNTGNPGEYFEPNPKCHATSQVLVNCDMPMGRVQIARYVPYYDSVLIDDMQCNTYAGVAMSDCTTWNPYCPLDKNGSSCWLRSSGGVNTYKNGGDPLEPDSKLKHAGWPRLCHHHTHPLALHCVAVRPDGAFHPVRG